MKQIEALTVIVDKTTNEPLVVAKEINKVKEIKIFNRILKKSRDFDVVNIAAEKVREFCSAFKETQHFWVNPKYNEFAKA